MFRKNSAVQSIFYLNIFIFLFSLLLKGKSGNPLIFNFAAYHWDSDKFEFYQLITYQFLHANFEHVFLNMLLFISLAPVVEKFLGYNKFILYYLLSGIFAALLHMTMYSDSATTLIGASGSIWGILSIYAFLRPNEELDILFLPFKIKSKYLIGFLFVSDLFYCIFVAQDRISHWAHVGGALTGSVLYLLNKEKNV
jgi:membrane associated rhomboid family serine protease